MIMKITRQLDHVILRQCGRTHGRSSSLLPLVSFLLLLVLDCQVETFLTYKLLRIISTWNHLAFDSMQIPAQIARPPGSVWATIPRGRHQRWGEGQKQRRDRLQAKLKAMVDKLSILLTNVWSLPNKMEELRLGIKLQWGRNLTKTWLNCIIPMLAWN